MLEILALIFLCKKNGDLALRKGLKPGTWKAYTIIAWIIAELVAITFAMLFFGVNDLMSLMLIGLTSAFGGYLLIRYILEKKPDHVEDDINSIGIDDLAPKR